MKKIISLLLCLVVLFGVFPVTSLDAATIKVSEEAKALETIGILIGDGHGVTSEYMAKRMDRFTAAISILKLKGLYEEALSYKGKTNFKDINTVSWGEGKNILAYIKANPSIGFIGNEKGEFLPGNYISEKEYYKVLLETLGYRQRVSGKAGDFKWDDTYDFAESVGLKPSYKIDFNIDLLAKATVSALNTKTKSGKVYINILIDEGVIKKAKAITAKLIKEAVKETSDFNLKSVKAVGNTVIELKFDDDINMYEAEDTYNYYINGLTIKDAYYMGNKTVRLVTSSQNSGKLYTLQVGDKKLKFTGVSKVSGSPSIKAIKSEDEETVVVEFDKELDFISAADIDNYYISGVDIEDAVLSGKKVTLTTYGLTPRKQYTLKVTNIKSIDGVLQKSQSKSFTNRPDTVPPTIKEVKAETNQRVVVIFSKGVSAETAEDLYNYTIEGNNTELDIYDAVLFGDDEDRVELETEPQKPGAKYEITIDNIADNTKAGNVMKKAVKKTFTGAREDKTAPQLSKSDVMVLSKYQIQLAFTDSSRLDEDTLLDEGNYEVYKNDKYKTEIYVDSVEKISYVDDKYKLVLEVEELEVNTSYTVKAYNISDEFGNILEKDNSITITVKKSDFAASAVKDYKVTKNNEIEIYFTKPLEKKSAEDISNYTISNNIGYPTKSVYKDGKVTLTTGAMVEGRLYKLTINGVYDEADNNIKTSFDFRAVIGDKKTQDDYDKPYITNVTALDKYTVEIKYNEDMGYGGIYTIANISYSSYYNIIPNTLKKIDKNKVLLSLSIPLEKRYNYCLTIDTQGKDLAGNTSIDVKGAKFYFNGTDVVTSDSNYKEAESLVVKLENSVMDLNNKDKINTAKKNAEDASKKTALINDTSLRKPLNDRIVAATGKITGAENKLTAAAVEKKIEALPDPLYITLGDVVQVEAVSKEYGNLTKEQKNLVTNYLKLKYVEDKIKYLIDEKNKSEADKTAANAVIRNINLLPPLSNIALEHKATIEASREGYNKLTGDQKKLVTNIGILENAEKIISNLIEDKKRKEEERKAQEEAELAKIAFSNEKVGSFETVVNNADSKAKTLLTKIESMNNLLKDYLNDAASTENLGFSVSNVLYAKENNVASAIGAAEVLAKELDETVEAANLSMNIAIDACGKIGEREEKKLLSDRINIAKAKIDSISKSVLDLKEKISEAKISMAKKWLTSDKFLFNALAKADSESPIILPLTVHRAGAVYTYKEAGRIIDGKFVKEEVNSRRNYNKTFKPFGSPLQNEYLQFIDETNEGRVVRSVKVNRGENDIVMTLKVEITNGGKADYKFFNINIPAKSIDTTTNKPVVIEEVKGVIK